MWSENKKLKQEDHRAAEVSTINSDFWNCCSEIFCSFVTLSLISVSHFNEKPTRLIKILYWTEASRLSFSSSLVLYFSLLQKSLMIIKLFKQKSLKCWLNRKKTNVGSSLTYRSSRGLVCLRSGCSWRLRQPRFEAPACISSGYPSSRYHKMTA